MYKKFACLLEKSNKTSYQVSKETGIAQSVLSDWKRGRSTPKSDNMKKIADYFGVTVDYLMTGKKELEKNDIVLTTKDNRDIARDLDNIMDKIESGEDGPLYYNDEPIDEESLHLLRAAIGMSLRHLKIINKEKYNPHKNKK